MLKETILLMFCQIIFITYSVTVTTCFPFRRNISELFHIFVNIKLPSRWPADLDCVRIRLPPSLPPLHQCWWGQSGVWCHPTSPCLVLLILGRWVECGAEYGLQSTYRGTAPANTSFAIRCQTSQDTRRMKVSQDLIQILLRVFCSGETSSQPAQWSDK